ncbi:MAG: pyridoxamine 5'-phosphate oxidase [Cyclobacteriaceae bacterium]|nr:pyridoxamine 5'-phosphate oxidase [Cyclobacteriaceae bacterium]
MKGISELRREYSREKLDMQHVDKNPFRQFEKWFREAIESEALEPNAMNLATVSEGGRPTSRVVLLKGVENDQFVFYTNYQSQKGRELDANPACALNFFWAELERQVRIEGIAQRVAPELSDQYFQSRPRDSQIGAWASPQSSIISDREILEARAKQIKDRFEGFEVLPRPKQWGGYGITPHEIEFWQGRPSRMHDRIVYNLIDEEWKINRLAP